jgi:hypothetical protein
MDNVLTSEVMNKLISDPIKKHLPAMLKRTPLPSLTGYRSDDS